MHNESSLQIKHKEFFLSDVTPWINVTFCGFHELHCPIYRYTSVYLEYAFIHIDCLACYSLLSKSGQNHQFQQCSMGTSDLRGSNQ